MVKLNRLWLVTVALLILVQNSAAAEKIWLDIDGGMDTNIGNAERSRDKINEKFLSLTANWLVTRPIDDHASLSLRVFLKGQKFKEIDELEQRAIGMDGAYSYMSGSDPMSWGANAHLSVELTDQGFSQRDSTITTARISASHPLSLRVTGVIGLEHVDRDSEGDVWDLKQWSSFISGMYEFQPTWSASATYNYIVGDVVSTVQTAFPNGTQANDIFNLVASADAIERDHAYNDALDGTWFSYRLPGETHTFQYAIGKDLDDKLSVDVSVMHVQVGARGNNDYESRIFRVALQQRF